MNQELGKTIQLTAVAGKRTNRQIRQGYHHWIDRSKESKIYKAVLFALAEGECPKCNRPMVLRFDGYQGRDLATLDHIIPISVTKEHHKYGLQIMCYRCNQIKADKI